LSLRRRIWEIVEVARPGDRASRVFDISILALIVLSVLAIILQSVEGINRQYHSFFRAFEVFSVGVFSLEYLLRIWSCVEEPRFSRPLLGRLRLALQPLLLLDLLAVLPAYLVFYSMDLRFLRTVRLIRLVRVTKLARYLRALQNLGRVLRAKREELLVTSGLMFLLLVVASCLVYAAEHEVQPEQFPNIPAAMWWAIATLTTVGYGDIYPVTVEGKVLASVVAVLGIGLFALPAGILGSGFMEAMNKDGKQGSGDESPPVCPHCGKQL